MVLRDKRLPTQWICGGTLSPSACSHTHFSVSDQFIAFFSLLFISSQVRYDDEVKMVVCEPVELTQKYFKCLTFRHHGNSSLPRGSNH